MKIVPLWFGIDTLEMSFDGLLSLEWFNILRESKEEAQRMDLDQPVEIAGREYLVSAAGSRRGYPYVLRGANLLAWVRMGDQRPTMLVKFLSQALVALGPEAIFEEACELAFAIGSTVKDGKYRLRPLNVTRLDVALDFQGWVPTFEEMRHMRCAARWRPVYPSTDEPETFQYGKGDVVLRVYDKTEEIVANGKEGHAEVWRRCPDYDPSAPVWRAEVQLRSTVLKELGIREPSRAMASTEAAFFYGIGTWATLRVPNSDSNPRRWPLHPAWEQLRAVDEVSEPLARIRQANELIRVRAASGRILSLLASVGARLGMDDLSEVMAEVRSEIAEILEYRETFFFELVEEKRRRLFEL